MSTIKVNTIEEATSGGATYFTAKAWVNFNGKNTVSIRDDGNVSSITDNATGRYTINIDNNLSSANYSATIGWAEDNGTSGGAAYTGARCLNNLTSGTVQFSPIMSSGWTLDCEIANCTMVL